MPVEATRTTAWKKVFVSGDTWVPVPVITEISFVDHVNRGQETHYAVDNSANSKRKTHTVTVSDGSFSLDVERIDVWPVKSPTARGQQTEFKFDNVTGEDATPPHFSTHLETHVTRYTSPSGDAFLDVEQIDKFEVKDAVNRGQQTIFTLKNTEDQADLSNPEISDTSNGIDPAWRIDPFKNIVSVGGETVFVAYLCIKETFGLATLGAPCASASVAPISDRALSMTQSDVSYAFAEIMINTGDPTVNSQDGWRGFAVLGKGVTDPRFDDSYLLGKFPSAPATHMEDQNARGLSIADESQWTWVAGPATDTQIPPDDPSFPLHHFDDNFFNETGSKVQWDPIADSPSVIDPNNGSPYLGPSIAFTGGPDLLPFAETTAATLGVYAFQFTGAPHCTNATGTGDGGLTAPTNIGGDEFPNDDPTNKLRSISFDFSPMRINYNGATYIPVGVQPPTLPNHQFFQSNYFIGVLFVRGS